MKIRKLFITVLLASIGAQAKAEVSCVAMLTSNIDKKGAEIRYYVELTARNTTKEYAQKVSFTLMNSKGEPIGGGSQRVDLFSGDSQTVEARAAGNYRLKWAKEQETRKRQEIQVEKVRKEKEKALVGAYCELGSFSRR